MDVDGPVHILSVVSRDRVALDDSAALRPMIFLKNKRNSSQIEQMLSPKTCVGVYIYTYIHEMNRKTYDVLLCLCVRYDNIFLYQVRICVSYCDMLNQTSEPRKKKKKTLTFHNTGWFLGILPMVYDNPYMTG